MAIYVLQLRYEKASLLLHHSNCPSDGVQAENKDGSIPYLNATQLLAILWVRGLVKR